MNESVIRALLAQSCSEKPALMQHQRNRHIYEVKELIKLKINGDWTDAATYTRQDDESGQVYCRPVDGFSTFDPVNAEQ